MRRLRHLWGLLCAAAFFLAGLVFVGKTGLEQDEAIFATPFFRDWCFYALPLGSHHRLPLMHMSYLGALKTWLYTPVFWAWPPSTAVIRIPALLLGSAAIVLFWFLLIRVHGPRAAIAGCVLLATDTMFLLTTTFDWGPDTLQHLLTIAAMLAAVLWHQTGRSRFLAAAAFCCGLAFWDKAVFGWMFAGLGAGSLVFIPTLRRLLTRRTATLAMGALITGALPLIIYNLSADQKLSTLRSNSQFTPHSLWPGVNSLRATWNGSGLLNIAQASAPQPNLPEKAMEEISFSLHGIAGDRHTNLIEPALIAALVILPLVWRTPARSPLLFALIATVAAASFMFLSGGGRSAHHTILLWPLPIFFVAIAFAEASLCVRFGAALLAVTLVTLTSANLLMTNQYLYQFIRCGSADAWTDAIYPLAARLANSHASQAVIVDWGSADQLCVLNRNDPPVHWIGFPFMPPGDPPAQRKADLEILADEKAIWIEHTAGHETLPGANDRVLEAARQAGYSPVPGQMFYDRFGRAIFQSLYFRLTTSPSARRSDSTTSLAGRQARAPGSSSAPPVREPIASAVRARATDPAPTSYGSRPPTARR